MRKLSLLHVAAILVCLTPIPIKSVEVTVPELDHINTATTAFAGYNKFFIGVTGNHTTQNLMQAKLSPKDPSGFALNTIALAPQAGVTVNAGDATASPLADKNITKVATLGNYPVAVDAKAPAFVYYVNSDDGKRVLRNASVDNSQDWELVCADGGSAVTGLHALDAALTVTAASPNEFTNASAIFAVVSYATNFGASDIATIGTSVIKKEATVLDPYDATDFGSHNQRNRAALIGFATTDRGALASVADATLDPALSTADICWDHTLQSLYIALSGIKTGAMANATAVGLAVGKFNGKGFNIVPAVETDKISTLKEIVGAKGISKDTRLARVKTMHTSTGHDYVVVNGAADFTSKTPGVWTYALPLVYNDNLLGDHANDGLLAKVTGPNASVDFTAIPDGINQLVLSDRADIPGSTNIGAIAVVGRNPKYLDVDYTTTIKDMQVHGDTVFVSLANAKSATLNAGIFESTAIFGANGAVRAWTDWQVTTTDRVYGFGFDETSNDLWYITNARKVKVKQWGAGNTNAYAAAAKTLPVALDMVMSTTNGGVLGMFNFDENTPSFKTYNTASENPIFSMAVATGYGKVALIETGKVDSGVFKSTADFSILAAPTATATAKTYVWGIGDSSPALNALGPIYTAELSRSAVNGEGWVFVGGMGGAAVLGTANTAIGYYTTGNGLAAISELSNFDFFLLRDATSGKSLFTNVRKMCVDPLNKFLFVMTSDAIYRLQMSADRFKTTNGGYDTTVASQYLKISFATLNALVTGSTNKFDPANDQFFDMIMHSYDSTTLFSQLIVGTTRGLWNVKITIAALPVITASEIKDKTTASLGPVLKIDSLPVTKGNVFETDTNTKYFDGNLYITAIDNAYTQLRMYRFNSTSTTIEAITEQYKIAPGYRDLAPYFFKIGDLKTDKHVELAITFFGPMDLALQDRYFGTNTNFFLDRIAMTPAPSLFLPTADPTNLNRTYHEIDLGIDLSKTLHMGSVVRDTASGMLCVPGRHGVIVNE